MTKRPAASRIGLFAALALALWVAALPESAAACAVCFSGRTDETRIAFGLSTLFLTVLPLMLLASGVWWVWRRARLLDAAPATAERTQPTRARSADHGLSPRSIPPLRSELR